jgi:hypothetical protein
MFEKKIIRMAEIQAQACVYTSAKRSEDPNQELADIKSAVINEALESFGKTTYGTYTKPETIYASPGGGLLMQRLKALEEEQRHTQMKVRTLEALQRKDEANGRVFPHYLRRTAASARRRFFAQSKLRGTGKIPDKSEAMVIVEGNHAVHRGDVITDSTLFELGDLTDREEFKRLYGVSATEALMIKCKIPYYLQR